MRYLPKDTINSIPEDQRKSIMNNIDTLFEFNDDK